MSKFEEKILGMKSSTKFFGLLVLLVWGVVEVKAQTLLYEQTFGDGTEIPEEFTADGWDITDANPSVGVGSEGGSMISEVMPFPITNTLLLQQYINIENYHELIITWNQYFTGFGETRIINVYILQNESEDDWGTPIYTLNTNTNWSNIEISIPVPENIENIQLKWELESDFATIGAYQIDDIQIFGKINPIIHYYNKPNSDLSNLSNWGTSILGEADSPISFDEASSVFHIRNGNNSINSNWNVNGTDSKVIIENGATFDIPSSAYYSGVPIDIESGNLEISNNTTPPLGELNVNSVVNYAGSDQLIYPTTFGTLEISGTNLKSFENQSEGLIVKGDLILQSSELLLPIYSRIEGNVVRINGSFRGTSESTLLVTGHLADLHFSDGYQMVGSLSINGDNSEVTVHSNLTANSLAIGSGMLSLSNSTVLVNSTLYIAEQTYINNDNGSINISGNGNLIIFHSNGLLDAITNLSNLYLSGTSKVTYSRGSGSQTITELPAPGYANLTLSGGATKEAGSSNIIIRGAFLRSSGLLNIGTSTFTFSGGTRALPNVTFHNLTMSNGAIADLGSNLNVQGNLTLSNGGTLNGGSRTINIAGNWEDNDGVFNAGTSNVFFNGTSAQSISGNTTFNNVVFSNTGMKTLNDNPSFSLITINNGATVDAGSSTLTLAGNFTNNGTFIPGTGTVVFNGNNTLLPETATFDFSNITINNVLNSSSVIQISGNWSNSGTFNHNDGKVIFTGGLEQTIPNSTGFYDLEINKTPESSLTLSSAVGIANVLKLEKGILNTNNHLTLISTPELTARIDKVEIGSTLNGEVNIQRTIERTKLGYYYLGTSIKGQTLQSWMDDFWVQGVDTRYPTAFKNVSKYDESTQSWVPVDKHNASLTPGVGYKVLMYASNFSSGSMTFDNKGKPVIGDGVDGSITPQNEFFEFNLSYTNSEENPQLAGFNFLSNPYPSDINWNSTGWDMENVDYALYIWDGNDFIYRTVMMDDPAVSDEIEKIASGQGFFVRATGPEASLRITENAKTGGATFFRKKAPENVIKLSLVDPNGRKDNTYVRMHKEGTTDFDIGLDAYKLKGDLNIFTKNEKGHHHAINTSALIKKDTTINIYTTVSQAGNYKINLSGLNTFKDQTQIWLKDNLLDKTLLVGDDFQYSFTISNEDKNKEINRFELIFNRLRVELAGIISDRDGSALSQATISLYQNDELISQTTSDENGKYSFNVVPHQSYQLIAEYEGNNMIQVEDIYTLVKSLNTQLPEADNDQFVAFDLDNSDLIDQNDLKLLIGAYLGLQQLQHSHQLISTNGNNNSFEIMPDTDVDDLSFVAIPKGQLNDDPFIYSNDSLVIDIEQINNPDNGLLQVDLVFDNENILAYQLKLKWDPTKIAFRDMSSTDLQYSINDETGELFLFDFNKNIPTLYFDALAFGEEITIQVLSESNALNSDFEMVGFSPRKKNVLGNSDLQLSLFKVSPVYPNPVRESGTIAFFIPEPDEVSFVIHDVNGLIIEESRRAYPQGENQLHWINGKNLKSGVYLYKIIYKNEVRIQKMVIQ